MIIGDLINRVDVLKPNTITPAIKLSWIKELIDDIKLNVWDTHEDDNSGDPLYNLWQTEDSDTVSITDDIECPDAYLKMFEYYLYAKIDLTNADYERYNNSVILYNDSYSKYKRWYHRAHMPKGNVNGKRK